MKINDVERMTGLTQKAIRLYETKGLIQVLRDENGYRNYSEGDVEILKMIKLLRSVDVSIADIKLYLSDVMRLDEIMDKRKTEIVKESGVNSEKYRICESLSKKIDWERPLCAAQFTENEEAESDLHGGLSVGIDIGTTTISAVVYDIDNRKQTEVYTVPHNAYVRSDIYSEQSVSIILDKTEKLLRHILDSYSNVISIGLSGQMHGIVYIDAAGNPCSDLINWQDKRADQPNGEGKTVCDRIRQMTGENIATGYGVATHYYNLCNGLVPEKAVGFCSIMDLFGMRICGLQKTVIHASVAASFGLFNVEKAEFQTEKLALLGMQESFLPIVTGKSEIIGQCRGIPVAVALGDNQASFLGSVRDTAGSILVNMGTGSQISTVSDYRELSGELELRPFVEGKYLICGSALCGGFAYAMIERFFRSYMVSAGIQEIAQYTILNQLAAEAYESGKTGLDVDVSFFGKRSDPDLRGSINRIDRQNFTPSELVLGVLKGMCRELYGLYEGFPEKKKHVVASGGAVKRNTVLQKLIGDCFGMTVSVNTIAEEAATGAALFSAFAIGAIRYDNGFSGYLR